MINKKGNLSKKSAYRFEITLILKGEEQEIILTVGKVIEPVGIPHSYGIT